MEKTAKIASTFKSMDTEEWLDIYFTRPIGYAWTRFFMAFNVHPNVVTIFSIFLGIGAGVMFMHEGLYYNIAGVLLLMWANFYDSCDGQLARLTGKKTQWGRILDGFAGDVWFFFIYVAAVVRMFHQEIPFTHVEWQWYGFALCLLSGVFFHARQCQLSDYYRNIHLYFLPGASHELHSSVQERQHLSETSWRSNFWWRIFLMAYIRYTHAQESLTPHFQQMMHYIHEERSGEVTDAFRQDFRKQSLPLMKYANFITFNWRAITLYVAFLVDLPYIYPLMELTFFTFVALYMQHRHESMCRTFLAKLKAGEY